MLPRVFVLVFPYCINRDAGGRLYFTVTEDGQPLRPDHYERRSGNGRTEAVQQTIGLVAPRQVQKAVALIENAKSVLCIGAGGSMIMAQKFAHLFSMVTGKIRAVSGSHMQVTAIATLEKDDVVVMFSYSGATQSGVQILALAKNSGVKTILITRFDKSPAAKVADVVLRCGSNEGPFQFGSVPAKIAQLVVMDVLFQEYCFRNRESSEASVQNIASAAYLGLCKNLSHRLPLATGEVF